MEKRDKPAQARRRAGDAYAGLVSELGQLLESARRSTVRVVNSIMTATYWDVGRRIIEFEQRGKERAGYGEELLERLAGDLTRRCGRGFSRFNLARFRAFYLAFPPEKIRATLSLESSAARFPEESLRDLARAFPLPWSHYVALLRGARTPEAFDFYHALALRDGWSVRQLQRQLDSLFFERTARSRNKSGMIAKSGVHAPDDKLTAESSVRDPLVLEFLDLRDEYSETELEDALIRHLEKVLLELGGDFTFVGRQRRLRIDDEWYRIDLIFYHRRLRCLIVIDLKLDRFTHADAGQMQMYLNYAKANWVYPGENPPVGVILCSSAGENLVHYSLQNLNNKILAREYRLALPKEQKLARALATARRIVESREAPKHRASTASPKASKARRRRKTRLLPSPAAPENPRARARESA